MLSLAYVMQWEDHKNNVHKRIRMLFEEQKFVDVTLFCDTHSIRVHSVVIASNSSYFEKVLLSQNGMNSVIVLKDMKFEVLRALVEFMYSGETTVLEEDIDALLFASKKFEIRGLSRMTRHDVTFYAEWNNNDNLEQNSRLSFPADFSHPGGTKPAHDASHNQETQMKSRPERMDCLNLDKPLLQRNCEIRNHGNVVFQETALSDTEYAILKEAEESRRALEKLQKYVSYPSNMMESEPKAVSFGGPPQKKLKMTENNFQDCNLQYDHSYSNLADINEDEIAANNLTKELNKDNEDIETTAEFPIDLPILVDDGNGNYLTLDDETAKMISAQEIKYHLVQGIVMAEDEKGNQVSNPANILVPENRINSTEVDWRESREEQDDEKPAEPERMFDTEPMEENFDFGEEKENSVDLEETSTDEECEKENLERKPFVVKEMVRLSQPKKKNGSSCKTLGEKDAADEINDKKEREAENEQEGQYLLAYDDNKVPYLINLTDDNVQNVSDDSFLYMNEKGFEIIGVAELVQNEGNQPAPDEKADEMQDAALDVLEGFENESMPDLTFRDQSSQLMNGMYSNDPNDKVMVRWIK